jgi:4-hydroxy-3-methylbut-2-enyl diphosphate reductase
VSLLVLTPMAIEEATLGNTNRVLRTGMGPERARIAAARALAIDAGNVAIAGLCGGVDPTLQPGDVVVASELRREDGTTVEVPGAAELAEQARRHGLRAHVGAVVTTDRVLKPAERASLEGALAVDMESAWLAAGAAGRPLAIARVVADAADRALVDPRMLVDGPRALATLWRITDALVEWSREAVVPHDGGPNRQTAPW